MCSIQNIPPKYKYPQAFECGFNFFISMCSWELENLLCSFFSGKEQEPPDTQPVS